ncbi:MAG: MBL fold metallo-hydrolase [Bacteroidota bacterium]
MFTKTRAALPVALVLAGAGLAAALGRTQETQELGVDTQEVAGTVRMLEGVGGFVGGNVAACVGPDGVLVVDSYVERNRGLLVEAVTALDAGEVRLAVNTHWHGDHAGNNAWFREVGAEVAAHENAIRRLAGDPTVEGRKAESPDAAAVPGLSIETRLVYRINGERVVLEHVGPGHTDGDVLVWFMDSKVLHMGDCFFKDRFPFIDLASGGSPSGILATVEHALDRLDGTWNVIPGHGSLATREDLARYGEMLDVALGRVREGLDDGQTFEDMREVGILDDLAEDWGGGFIDKDAMLSSLVTGLRRGR